MILETARESGRLGPGRRIYAIGDIHGEYDSMRRLVDRIHDDVAKRPVEIATVVFLGDYVDRGGRSADVLRFLLTADLPGGPPVMLRGNHEEMMIAAAHDDDVTSLARWLQIGGLETLASLGVPMPQAELATGSLNQLRRDWLSAMPATHLAFLESLPVFYKTDGYAFVHAGLRPGVPLPQQDLRDFLWIREPFLSCEDDYGIVIVHGHTPNMQVENRANRINVDTGAFATGRLSAVILEDRTRAFIDSLE